ncbi:hypothetical protein [Alteromonas sp. CYL-A6]|uniref:hypothetical protein n=1 Tax=Alteromonas nitratireducens TaxID=3390813 RepID=UPI0034C50789
MPIVRMVSALSALLFLVSITSKAESVDDPTRVRIPKAVEGTTPLYQYLYDALALSLTLTEPEYGPFVLEIDTLPSVQARQLTSLRVDQADVIWSITTPERESRYDPVYFPLLGGLFSYRLLLIRDGDTRFSSPISKDALRTLTAVQGEDWPDYTIMKDNGFTVEQADYQIAFKLLKGGFVDYFPRAAFEICGEMQTRDGFAIDPQHVLWYPNIMLFFVNKQKPELAQRIQSGLQKATASGELITLLTRQPFFKTLSSLIRHKTRIELVVSLSEQTGALLDMPFYQQISSAATAEADPVAADSLTDCPVSH